MTSDPCEVIVTAPNPDWLADICRALVDQRLASSAHVLGAMSSIYRWDGEVHEAQEARAFIRTRVSLVPAIVAYIRPKHPYAVPNITALPIVDGNPDYLAWVHEETRSTEDRAE